MAVSSAKKQFMIWLVLGEIRGVDCIEKWTKDASLWNSGFYASNIGERMIELDPEGPVSKVFYKDDNEIVWNLLGRPLDIELRNLLQTYFQEWEYAPRSPFCLKF
ncbi:hypothetical protein AVEN_45274-1 [Araneus ventricosus]|uniref:Uncharacterized protein n=1 Tax=Araneus ventricosus TaxID=182803 RepID=A0A4Y2Q954_ARAVE|nr:hypothetical protein AVEN_45274-1 [Araneus ventricosus]